MKNLDNEPSNDKIEDYDGHESKEKRNTVKLVIIFCLVAGAFFAYIRSGSVSTDYVGTQDKPGINTMKK